MSVNSTPTPDPATNAAVTEQVVDPYALAHLKALEYSSWITIDDLMRDVGDASKGCGFSIAKLRSTNKVKGAGDISASVHLMCRRSSVYRPYKPKDPSKKTRQRASKKTDCPWRAIATMLGTDSPNNKNPVWRLKFRNLDHNHELNHVLDFMTRNQNQCLERIKEVIDTIRELPTVPHISTHDVASQLQAVNSGIQVTRKNIGNMFGKNRQSGYGTLTPHQRFLYDQLGQNADTLMGIMEQLTSSQLQAPTYGQGQCPTQVPLPSSNFGQMSGSYGYVGHQQLPPSHLQPPLSATPAPTYGQGQYSAQVPLPPPNSGQMSGSYGYVGHPQTRAGPAGYPPSQRPISHAPVPTPGVAAGPLQALGQAAPAQPTSTAQGAQAVADFQVIEYNPNNAR
ncbi:hypothetical protein N7461_002335 [Penicillium sp. DV-2018c]|nr:hypothetical protein N7461_002335 [Penicillium sp. DV-2018c]